MGEDQLDYLELDGPITLKILDGNRLGLHPSKMMDVIKDHEMLWINLELLLSNLHGKAGSEGRRRGRLSPTIFYVILLCKKI